MRILIIGGTRFVGRHLVETALTHGHICTLFHRGQTNPELFPQVETILGDREKDLGKCDGKHWDVVIDTCGYLPRLVSLSAQAFNQPGTRYAFISSISVYSDGSKIGITENDPVGKLEDESQEVVNEESYGPLKVLCEKSVQSIFHDRALIIRPGLIVGPYDPTDRFTYWPVRVARGGELIAPEKPQVPVQFIDARDLAEFIIRLIEQKASGTFNATGPNYPLSLGRMLEACQSVSGSDAVIRWASVDFLAEHKVEPWSDMPVWVPDTPAEAGFSRIDVSKGIAAGLLFRPLEETIRDTLAWAQNRTPEHAWRAGLKPERETELLQYLRSV